MPAPLYARYVPPKKSAKATVESSVESSPQQSSTQNKLYARYVPPKKQKPLEVAQNTEPQETTDAVEDNGDAKQGGSDHRGNKKRKRDEGEKKPKSTEKTQKTRKMKEVVQENEAHIAPAFNPHGDAATVDTQVAENYDHGAGDDYEHGDDEEEEEEEEEEVDINSIFAKYSVSGAVNRKATTTQNHEVKLAEEKEDSSNEEDGAADAGAQAVFAKYKKSLILSEKRKKKEDAALAGKEPTPEVELHGLEPMPQPEKAPYIPYRSNFSSLPEWISNPRAVQSDATLSFDKLRLSKKLRDNLRKKGFDKALAVQSAVLPLLLPGKESYHGDICVSAPTGSGKTLAYVLPMIDHLQWKATRRLRGLIIVPTRELVAQAKEIAKACASGLGLRIGTAVGSVPLHEEQVKLVVRGQRYDPEARQALDEEAERRMMMLGYNTDDELLKDIVDLLPGHVPEFSSDVDILICTPGRLVDHIRSTPGFTAEHVEWLVIDEADRLLDSNFQGWVDIVLPALETKVEQDGRSLILSRLKEKAVVKQIRKVILSATMTRDLSKLASLKLNRPTLVAVAEPEQQTDVEGDDEEPKEKANKQGAILPSTLKEIATPTGDGSEKPLYLLKLLKEHLSITSADTRVLIFCANDDNAARLARLLALLSPDLEARIGMLTKATTTTQRRKTLSSFESSSPDSVAIMISTDRTSRGLDVEGLTYVVNYDVPPSVTSYVHRVGRTARAGKNGTAWTLHTDSEARWFWRTIARGKEISRSGREVERTRLAEPDEESRDGYARALESLQEAVKGR